MIEIMLFLISPFLFSLDSISGIPKPISLNAPFVSNICLLYTSIYPFGSCKFISHILIVIKIDGIRAEICKPRKTNFTWNFRLHSVIRRTIAKPKIPGKIRLTGFTNFCPYTIDLDYYKDCLLYTSTQRSASAFRTRPRYWPF